MMYIYVYGNRMPATKLCIFEEAGRSSGDTGFNRNTQKYVVITFQAA